MGTRKDTKPSLSSLVKEFLATEYNSSLTDFVPDDFIEVVLSAAASLHDNNAPNLLYLLAKALTSEDESSQLQMESISFKLLQLMLLSVAEQHMESIEVCSVEFLEELEIIEWDKKSLLPGLNEILFPTHTVTFKMAPKIPQSQHTFMIVPYADSDELNEEDMSYDEIEIDQPMEDSDDLGSYRAIEPFIDDEFSDFEQPSVGDEIKAQEKDSSETRVLNKSHDHQPEMAINPKDLVKMYQCLQCPVIVRSEEEISKHVKEVHGGNIGAAKKQEVEAQHPIKSSEEAPLDTSESQDVKPPIRTEPVVATKVPDRRRRAPPDPSKTCSLCTRTFPTESEKLEHESKANCLFCSDCNTIFGDKEEWTKHHRMEHGKTLSLCPFCNKEYRSCHLTRHIDCVHFNVRKHRCPKCNRGFFEKKDRVKHELTCETNEIVCKHCPDILQSMSSFKEHLKYRHDMYLCRKCNETLQSITSYRKHMQDNHYRSKDKIEVMCEQCGKVFPGSSQLKRHIRFSHNAEQQPMTTCTICNKSFKSPHYLKRHVQIVHEKLKNYCCEVCGKNFSSSAHLQEHVGVHDNIKRYICETCGEGFIHRASYKRHVIKHIGSELFPCSLCNRKFDTPCYLKNHVRRVHKGSSVEVINFQYPGSTLPPNLRKRAQGGRQHNKLLNDFRQEDNSLIEIAMTMPSGGYNPEAKPSAEQPTESIITEITQFDNVPQLETKVEAETEETVPDLDLINNAQIVQIEEDGITKMFYVPEGAEYIQIGENTISLEDLTIPTT